MPFSPPLNTFNMNFLYSIAKNAFNLLLLILISISTSGQTFDYLPTSTTSIIITHSYYSLSYSQTHKQAEWVAYVLKKVNLEKGIIPRSDNFRPDPKISVNSASLQDYSGSGYDRGHLAPAGDMKFDTTAMSETFFLSNISPQLPSFNRGIWKHLEDLVRNWAIENEMLYVVTGGILKYALDTIGQGNIIVPKYYYKIILDYTEPEIKSIAFILPNEKGVYPLYEYVVTIDSIEAITGIDFFPGLPDDIEFSLEEKKQANKWSFEPAQNNSITPKNNTDVQCKGLTQSGDRCRNITKYANGYCYLHQSQAPSGIETKQPELKLVPEVQCSALNADGTRCVRMTNDKTGKCWQHKGE